MSLKPIALLIIASSFCFYLKPGFAADDCSQGNALSCYTQALIKLQAAEEALKTARKDITSLQTQINEINERVLPLGAVVPFDLLSGCPKGWLPFDAALGRVIIGANSNQSQLTNLDQSGAPLSARKYGESGGREIHKLTLEQLPPLQFSITVDQAVGHGSDKYDAGGRVYAATTQNISTLYTNTIGSGEAFGIMPPFVSLFYCKSEK